MKRLGVVPSNDSDVPTLGQLVHIGGIVTLAIADMGYRPDELQLLSTRSGEFQVVIQNLVKQFIGPRFRTYVLHRYVYTLFELSLEELIERGYILLANAALPRPRFVTHVMETRERSYDVVEFEERVTYDEAISTLDRFYFDLATITQLNQLYTDNPLCFAHAKKSIPPLSIVKNTMATGVDEYFGVTYGSENKLTIHNLDLDANVPENTVFLCVRRGK